MIMPVTRARERGSSFISKPFSIHDLVKMQILLLPEVRRKETRSERNKLGKSVVGIRRGERIPLADITFCAINCEISYDLNNIYGERVISNESETRAD